MTVSYRDSAMDPAKKERLEAKGWKVGTVSEFLKLTPEDMAIIEMELSLMRKAEQAENGDISKDVQEVNLGKWLVGIIDEVWGTVEEVLGEKRAKLALGTARGGASYDRIVRAQPIDLGMRPDALSLALVVAVMPESAQEWDIRLQVHPTGSQTYLPSGLKCAVLDPSVLDPLEEVYEEIQAGNASDWIQLNVTGESGEQFTVKIELGDDSTTRNFVI